MMITYQIRAGSGYWAIVGCPVVPDGRSLWWTAVISRLGELLDLPLPSVLET